MYLRSVFLYYVFAALLLSAVTGLNVYRAATQSITIDEAFTYTEFVEPPFGETLSHYDANNHILFSLAARLSVAIFPVSELTLRLPTLLAGAAFLAAVSLLCALALGPCLLFLAAIALVALNPFVLDYLSAARGYGLGLACWFCGLMAMIAGLRRERAPVLIAAGSLGAMLAVATNLVFVFPAAGLLGTTLTLLMLARRYRLLLPLLLPVALAGALLFLSPLRHAQPGHYYHGTVTLSQSLESLGTYTFFYTSDATTLAGQPYWTPWPQRRVLGCLSVALMILGAGAVLVTLRGAWRFRRGALDERSLPLVMLAGSTVVGGLALAAAHHMFGVRYPASRTGLFWIVSASLLAPLLAGRLRERFRWGRPVASALAVCGLLCAAYLASQVRTADYAEWRFDAGTRDMVRRIDALHRGHAPLRVGATWTLASSMEFYRRVWRLRWEPVRRLPAAELEQGARSGLFDYLVLLPAEHYLLERTGWHTIFLDRRTDAILAGPSGH